MIGGAVTAAVARLRTAGFDVIPETITEARLMDDTVGWVVDGNLVDIAPDALWDHTRRRCGGGGCTGWTPEQTVVVRLL